MPGSAAAPNDGRLTSDRARELVGHRWQHDNQGLQSLIDRLDRRRSALTDGQRDQLADISGVVASAPAPSPEDATRLRALLPAPAGDHAAT